MINGKWKCILKATFSSVQFSSVQSLSRVWLFATQWMAAHQASMSITNSQSSPRLTCDAIQPSHPRSSPSPPALSVPQHQGLFNELSLHIRWLKYWSFSFSISLSNEYSGLIFSRMDWLDLLAVQGTLKSLLQPQFKNITSLALNLLHGPTLTSIHDYWKNHSFDLYGPLLTKWCLCFLIHNDKPR